ncbi:MAG: tetratricopeptide repeat protein [Xenococcaceae cyanobacterium MO_207.B15]|nr:tetratricopeptide repeat protein [Xenococcaceae cyanobacterium MO_207.B15]
MSRKVALLIGVSEYGEGILSLSAPINDVAAMERVLKNPKMGGFDQVEPIINPEPTAMRLAVQQIFTHLGKDDLVLLFFSGHGITDDNNKLYLATKGTSKDFYKATSVPASFIQDISLESYAKRQVIILDCCYSGAFAEGWQAKSVGIDLEKELGAEGRVVLTSSTATQPSFQQEGKNLSLYTQYLVEGIETGAAGKKEQGKIYAFELHDYAKAKVQEVKPKQQPGIIIDKEGFNILLSQAPVGDPELNFRKLVENYTTQGQVTVTGKYILPLKRQELGITEERSEEIINEVLAPYRKHIENIEFYQQAFADTVKHHYPLTERLLNELQDLQDILGLEDNDIAEIKESILVEKEAEYQQKNAAKNWQPNRISAKESKSQEANQNFLSRLFSSLFQMSSEDFFNRGLDKHNKGDQRGAIEDYTQAIALNPDDSDAYYTRGNAHYDLKDYQAAIEDYNKAIQINQNWGNLSETYFGLPTAYYNRGNTHKNLKDYQQAIADYTKAIELNPEYSQAYNNRGIAHKNLKDYQQAIADYTKAIELNPDYANAYYNRGNTHDDLKDYQQAIADYTKAIELNPEYADAYYNRGNTHKSLQDNQAAIKDYQKAADLYKQQGKTDDYQDAIDQVKKLEN